MVTTNQPDEEESIAPQEAERVLGILCVKYGFCLTPLWQARLRDCPPRSVSKFTDTVFHAEGLDPLKADSVMYRAMSEEVRLGFERSKSLVCMPSNTSLERTRKG